MERIGSNCDFTGAQGSFLFKIWYCTHRHLIIFLPKLFLMHNREDSQDTFGFRNIKNHRSILFLWEQKTRRSNHLLFSIMIIIECGDQSRRLSRKIKPWLSGKLSGSALNYLRSKVHVISSLKSHAKRQLDTWNIKLFQWLCVVLLVKMSSSFLNLSYLLLPFLTVIKWSK